MTFFDPSDKFLTHGYFLASSGTDLNNKFESFQIWAFKLIEHKNQALHQPHLYFLTTTDFEIIRGGYGISPKI